MHDFSVQWRAAELNPSNKTSGLTLLLEELWDLMQ